MTRPSRLHYISAICFILFLLFFQKPAVTEPIRGFSLSALKPALVVGEAVTHALSEFAAGVGQFWRAFRDRRELESKVAVLESELEQLREAERENQRLKKLLDFRSSMIGKTVPARIVGWDPLPWRKVVVLDKGNAQGIKEDMAVVVPEGLVGRVLEAAAETAQVILLIDADSRVSALTSESRTQGVVAGNGSPQLEMSYLDLDSGVSIDEIILSSGVGGIFPKGVPIGRIVNLARGSQGLHLIARIEPRVRFSKLEEVLCVERYPVE